MRVVAFSVLTAMAVLVSGQGSSAAAQSTTRLASADAAFPEAFSTVRGFRELADGRLLVSDGLGQALMIVDIDAGTADTVGRVGGGPGEYRMPDGLFSLPGDSVLLVDLGNGRLTIFDASLEFARAYPIMAGSGEGLGTTTLRLPRAVDAQGRIYYQQTSRIRPGSPVPDSAMIVRWDPSQDRVDTIARVKVEKRELREVPQGIRMVVTPLSPMDEWTVAHDGSIGLVRSNDYRVEWIRPDGRVVRGNANPFEAVRISAAEKEAWVNTRARDALAVSMDIGGGGVRQASFSRGGGGGRQTGVDDYEWPEYMQGFVAGAVYASPSGELWVRRSGKSGAETTFDVFDRSGVATRRIILPAGRQLVGFGMRGLYTVRADEFDLMWLERFNLEL